MNKKYKIISILIFLIIIAIAYALEKTDAGIIESGVIQRGQYGEGDTEQILVVNADGVLEDYTYDLIIKEQKLTSAQIQNYIDEAKQEIEQTFCGENQSLENIRDHIVIKDKYAGGIVKADWQFAPNGIISEEGRVDETKISDEGTLVNTSVEIECEDYKEVYQFSFLVYPTEKTRADKLIMELDRYFENEYKEAGLKEVKLPNEIDGVKLAWSAPKQYLVIKVIIFGLAFMVLLHLSRQNNRKKEQKERLRELELDYPDMVGKLAILLGSGMTLKKAWDTISARYSYNRQKGTIRKRKVYEEMLKTNREISDGEAEVKAYQKFADRTGSNLYQRLIRLLIQNIQKGNKEIHNALEEETLRAFEQRKNLVKIMGEEAGTKMLFPLILMLIIVMAIVIAPAMLNLQL